MYKIMLAEDQPEVLQAIIKNIDWARYSFLPPMGCCDGRAAIAAIENGFVPDAVITDICMPVVSGLELVDYINQWLPKTVVVVLSGYDEFAYAQQALKLGVHDYVLKPVTPDNMGKLLESLSAALDAKRMHDIDDSLQILFVHFLNRLITRPQSDEIVEENLRRHNVSMCGPYYLTAVLDIDGPGLRPDDPDSASNTELMRYALYNMTLELIDLPNQALIFQATDGTTKVLLAVSGQEEGWELGKRLLSLVCQTFQLHMSCSASAGVGNPVLRLGAVCDSHRHAQAALAYRFFTGEGSVLNYCDLNRREKTDSDISKEFGAFEQALRQFHKERTAEVIAAIFAKLRDNHQPFSKCVLCCQRLIVLLHEFINQLGDAAEREAFIQAWERMDFLSVSTIGQLEEQLQALCRHILDLFEPLHTSATAQLVNKAEEYIRTHYSEQNLSLQSIADHLAVSVSHFSAHFKTKTGSTFLEYLTKVRMNKAKQLLALSDLLTYEIAQAVGYADPHYFSVAFKRYTGMSPKEYREYSAAHSAWERSHTWDNCESS